MRTRRTAAMIALSVMLAISVVYGWRQTTLAESYRHQVDAGYRKALYETMELVESMRVNLAKLQVTSSSTNRRKLLAELALYAEGAQADLAALPEGMSFSGGALKFFNQAADFSVSYLEEREGEEEAVARLLQTCTDLYRELDEQRQRLESGEDIFARTEDVPESTDPSDTQVLVKYPTLLYDGPFSDGRQREDVQLSGNMLSRDQAEEAVRLYVGEGRIENVDLIMESYILSECYEFDVQTTDGLLSLAMTKQGGHVVYMLCDTQPEMRKYSVSECVDFAGNFLAQRGYGDMRVSYWKISGAMITVNFAAVQEGVILYPDLVKVDVSMESGSVIGIEAMNYLSAHRQRTLPTPVLTEEQARTMISPDLSVLNTRLCLIPDHRDGETLCYEVCAAQGEKRYLIYIDAMTGDEAEILQIMETENGQLAV